MTSVAISRAFLLLYVGLRSAEGVELAFVTYGQLGQALTAASVLFLFAFAVCAANAGARPLGRRAAFRWHLVGEIILLPIFLYLAFDAADRIQAQASPVAVWGGSALVWFAVAAFLALQIAVSFAGMHILKWASRASRPTRAGRIDGAVREPRNPRGPRREAARLLMAPTQR